ncbi:MAG: molybdopterin-dependent oxidoreductase [Brevirhabdus sp.]
MDGAAEPQLIASDPPEAGATIRTTCPYCGVGCGVLARATQDGGMVVKGDKAHPANFGKLCSKGSALGETVGLEDRLLAPMAYGKEVGWDHAIDLVATKFRDTIAEHGPDSVALYVSGQLLTEDYYVANKLVKGYFGTGNIDTNSRLCMASSVAGHKRAFGADTVPGLYADFDEAELIVLVGSNLAWCHPVLFQQIAAAKKANPALKVVNIDPRRTATSDIADMHLAVEPGSDVALFNGLLARIVTDGVTAPDYVAAHVNGFDEAVAAAQASDAAITGLSEAERDAFYALWTGTEKVVTVYSQGVNQSTSGSDKVNAIINCHLATGRIGRPGMGPFSVTGQPNAMGGREVGGLANMLACHMDIENEAHRKAVQGFWASPTIATEPGLKAVDMFRAVGDGRIKAIWIIHTNPAVSLPEADAVRDAIKGCEFTVVSDITARTDTAELADVLLPATAWGEKDGTVTNSERCISRQRRVLPAPGATRDDWRIICDVARAMGFEGFDYPDAASIFAEYATLSGVAGQQARDFDISALAGIDPKGYEALEPFHWPVSATKTGGRFFGEGGFFTPDTKARMLPLTPRPPVSMPDDDFPFRLNTGRVRDHWHTMTRTAKSSRLSQHIAEPYLEIHPDDAARLGLEPATLALVESPVGKAVLRVLITDRIAAGQVFAPMHWTAQTSGGGRVDALVRAATDPVSGQPESKASVARVGPFAPGWYGFAVSCDPFRPMSEYWAMARTRTGYQAELAGLDRPLDWGNYARELFGVEGGEILQMADAARGVARLALVRDGAVKAALFTGPSPVGLNRRHVTSLPGSAPGPGLLAGMPSADLPDPGPIICACFDIGRNTIVEAIESGNLTSVEAIGQALRAGTNCGSCRPELHDLLKLRD